MTWEHSPESRAKRVLCSLGLLLAVLLAAAVSGCMTVAATGERYVGLVDTQREIAIGEQANRQIRQSIGLVDDPGLREYVAAVGRDIAAVTERPDLPWTFGVLDDPAVNAFALPGGYLYLTRGILAHMENEAQMVGVLSHEIAHVTAKHSVIRMSRGALAQLGLGLATVVAPELEEYAGLAGMGIQLLFLKYSRDDELQADALGVRYMREVGEDPRALEGVMQMLERVSEAGGSGTVPQWASTHPAPRRRIEQIREETGGAAEAESYRSVDREAFLRRLDGLLYGPDPRQGFFRGSRFYQPELRFQYAFPDDWDTRNQPDMVLGQASGGAAAIQLSIASEASLQAAAAAFAEKIETGRAERRTVNGIPALTQSFVVRRERARLRGRVVFLDFSGRIYRAVGYARADMWNRTGAIIEQSLASFKELENRDTLDVELRRLQIVTVERAEPLRIFHKRRSMPISLEELSRLNQLRPDAMLETGRLIKVVRAEKLY